MEQEILIIASKLKKYIKQAHGLSTSGAFLPAISNEVRRLCDRAANCAKDEGRKTVLDRHVQED